MTEVDDTRQYVGGLTNYPVVWITVIVEAELLRPEEVR